MRKLLLSFITMILIIFLVSACSNEGKKNEEEAIEVGEKFLETLYNEDDTEFDFEDVNIINDITEEYTIYLTEKELDELTTTRFLFIPKEIATKRNLTLSIKDIDIAPYDRDEGASDEIDVTQIFTLVYTDEAGKDVEEEVIEGQMTLVKTKEGFKIDRYHDTGVPMELLE